MQLRVLTPDEVILDTDVETIRVQLPDGWWGILPGHAPFLAHVIAGFMRYRYEGNTRYIALYQGTIEVQRRAPQPGPVSQDRAGAVAAGPVVLVEDPRRQAALPRLLEEPSDERPPGVTVIGDLQTSVGIGRVAAEAVSAEQIQLSRAAAGFHQTVQHPPGNRSERCRRLWKRLRPSDMSCVVAHPSPFSTTLRDAIPRALRHYSRSSPLPKN